LIFTVANHHIAWPLAWLAMSRWLEGFAYKVHMNLWMFIISGASAFIVALLTVSYQAIRTALLNPVKSLKTE